MKSIKADEILISYLKPDKTMREIFLSIPKDILLEMKKSYEVALQDDEIINDNVCPLCHHLHNNGIWERNKIRLFLERIEQTLAGKWI